MVDWQDYQQWLNGEVTGAFPKAEAPDVALWNRDTRNFSKGQWYLPLVGERFDGHQFITHALKAGAAGFLYQPEHASHLNEQERALGIPVKNTLTAIQKIAHGWRKKLTHTKIIALTGSAGKTTVKEILGLILSRAGKTIVTQGSYNNELGVPLTLLSIPIDAQYAVLEMGARKSNDIRFLTQIAAPDIGAVLNVGTAHLGIFGSIEALLHTKTEMFRDTPDTCTLVAYGDDPRIVTEAKATQKKFFTFGTKDSCDIRFFDVRWEKENGMSFSLQEKDGQPIPIQLKVAHDAYPVNICAASAMAKSCGLELTDIAKALEGFSGLDGRYKIIQTNQHIIVDDAYNANPSSARAGLKSLSQSFAHKPVALILGDMLELGDSSDQDHQALGAFAGEHLQPRRCWCIGPSGEEIAKGIQQTSKETSISVFKDVSDALETLKKEGIPEQVIYLKASNGIGLKRLVEELRGDA